MRRELFIVTPKKCIFWILYACIVFSVAYSLFGISLSTFYLCDVLNLMLLYFEAKYIKEISNCLKNKKFIVVILWSAKKYSIIEKRTYVLLKMLGGAANAGADTQLCSN